MPTTLCPASNEDINPDLEALQAPHVDRDHEARSVFDDEVDPTKITRRGQTSVLCLPQSPTHIYATPRVVHHCWLLGLLVLLVHHCDPSWSPIVWTCLPHPPHQFQTWQDSAHEPQTGGTSEYQVPFKYPPPPFFFIPSLSLSLSLPPSPSPCISPAFFSFLF